MFEFALQATDTRTAARLGRFATPHGLIDTPAFMPVGTAGAVKGLTPDMVRSTGAQMILANTYHLALRPGPETVAELGGLHRFCGWEGPILTDSGGYQVFSLGQPRGTPPPDSPVDVELGGSLVRVDDDGVTFRSHIDGALLRLTPEEAVRIQELLGADVIMAFDECPPGDAPREQVERATSRSIQWAMRCKAAKRRDDQALFGIVQGGAHLDLRIACAEQLLKLDFPGYAIGGLAVGESAEERAAVLRELTPHLPPDRPRYLMGVGRPMDILSAVACGIDLFDCVLPTRNARHGQAFTSQGMVRLKNAAHERAREPLDAECDCYTCGRFSRGYLRHLLLAGELLGLTLVSLHNLAYYQRWMRQIRQAIADGRLADLFLDLGKHA